MVMITDIQFLDICQKYSLVASKGGSENSEYYAVISLKNKIKGFHNYITGFKMVDHINRIPMDNRLSNLREADYKLNNNNRSQSKKAKNTFGIRFRMYKSGKDVFIARIKQDGKEYSKKFPVKKYGYDEAKRLAIEYRAELNRRFGCKNVEKVN